MKKNNKYRFTILLLVLVLVLAFAVGCGSKDTEIAPTDTPSITVEDDDDVMEDDDEDDDEDDGEGKSSTPAPEGEEVTSAPKAKGEGSEKATEPPAEEEEPGTYAEVTSKSDKEVESFAKSVKSAVVHKDWDSLSAYLSYPTMVLGMKFKTADAFTEFMADKIPNPDFISAIKGESCKSMTCQSDGIYMGDGGQICINEKKGALKVTEMDGLLQ